MSVAQGHLLEVTVVKCKDLKHTEYVSWQEDPYVCLEYGSDRYHTRTCTDGDANLILQEKFKFTLFEGSKEISISVYNGNTFHREGFIGRGRVQLQRVISQGYDDTSWPIFSESGRTTGEVCLLLYCPSIKIPATNCALPAVTYVAPAPAMHFANPYLQPTIPTANCFTPVSRGLKRPLQFESYLGDEEELGRDPMRRKLRTDSEGRHLQPSEVLDIAMDELLDRTSPTAIDEDTEMTCGSHPPSPPYSTIWDTICF